MFNISELFWEGTCVTEKCIWYHNRKPNQEWFHQTGFRSPCIRRGVVVSEDRARDSWMPLQQTLPPPLLSSILSPVLLSLFGDAEQLLIFSLPFHLISPPCSLPATSLISSSPLRTPVMPLPTSTPIIPGELSLLRSAD